MPQQTASGAIEIVARPDPKSNPLGTVRTIAFQAVETGNHQPEASLWLYCLARIVLERSCSVDATGVGGEPVPAHHLAKECGVL